MFKFSNGSRFTAINSGRPELAVGIHFYLAAFSDLFTSTVLGIEFALRVLDSQLESKTPHQDPQPESLRESFPAAGE